MPANDFWYCGLRYLRCYIEKYNREQKKYYEDLDYLAWNIGDYFKASLSGTPILTYTPERQSDANNILRKNKYPKKPKYILNNEKNKELTDEEKQAEKKRLENWINNIKPKKQ